jgi:hypothetical protein
MTFPEADCSSNFVGWGHIGQVYVILAVQENRSSSQNFSQFVNDNRRSNPKHRVSKLWQTFCQINSESHEGGAQNLWTSEMLVWVRGLFNCGISLDWPHLERHHENEAARNYMRPAEICSHEYSCGMEPFRFTRSEYWNNQFFE